MAENGADSAHFGFVHGQAVVPSVDSYDTDGPVARMRSTQRWPTGDSLVDAFVEATSHGPGFSVIRMTGIIDTVSVGCNTPVSGDRVATSGSASPSGRPTTRPRRRWWATPSSTC
jgi:hypothetical protein